MASVSVDVILVVAAVLLVAIAITTWVLYRIFRSRKSKKVPLASQLQKPGKKTGTAPDGSTYEYQYTPGSQYSPASFTVRVPCPSQGAFYVAKENRLDRFAKRIGLVREIQTGDPEFDDRFFVQTECEGFTSSALESPECRSAIQFLFQLGFTAVRLKKNKLEAVWQPFSPKKQYVDEKLLDKTSSLLIAAAGGLSEIPDTVALSEFDLGAWRTRRALAMGIALLSVGAGVVALLFGLTNYKPLDPGHLVLNSLRYSLPFLVFFVLAAFHLLKGRSSSHKELALVLFFSVAGFPLAGAGGEMFLNGWLDRSGYSRHDVKVLNKYFSKSDKSTTYYAVVESWREGRATEKLSVPSGFYNQLEGGITRLIVTTRAGRFGFEWLASYAILQE